MFVRGKSFRHWVPFSYPDCYLSIVPKQLCSPACIFSLLKHSARCAIIKPYDFSIIGSWKSIGDSGFGQVQPGSIVTFDEEHCNFYSPNDTYSLYRSGEDILLECTSTLFSDTLMFNVVIIDDNNIQIQYGSVTTKLKRLDTSLGEGPGAEPPNFSIVGSWKSVGDWGFGQAQPGATVRFDGSRCNFYSPYDTYEFYKEDGKWKLSCKNVLWQDVLTFTVEIIDNDNINIYYGSSYVTILKRVD